MVSRAHPDASSPPSGWAIASLLALLGLALFGSIWLVRQAAELRSEVGTAITQAASLRKGFRFQEARKLLEQVWQRLQSACWLFCFSVGGSCNARAGIT